MVDFLLALLLPFTLMLVVTRVAFNIYGALIVTLMVLLFGLNFHEKSIIVNLIAIASLILGFIQSRKLLKKKPGM